MSGPSGPDGRGAGPAPTPLVLLPGLHGTAGLFEDFRRQVPAGFEVTAVSYPPELTSYDAALDFVSASLAGLDSAVVVAESFSSPVAVRYAATHPDRVARLVLVAGFVRPPGPRWSASLPLRFGIGLGRVLLPVATPLFGSRSLTKRVRSELRPTPSRVLAARLRSVLTVDVVAELGRVRAPILYLAGMRDCLVGRRALRHVAAHASRLEVRELPTTHFVLQNEPVEAWRAISEFCAGENGT